MHELKVTGVKKAARKMMMTSEGNHSIEENELGENVLTLHEVLQTFEVESPMYNIKLKRSEENSEEDDYRTVVLEKNQVEIAGSVKLIIMIRDVSDRVRLEQEQIKK